VMVTAPLDVVGGVDAENSRHTPCEECRGRVDTENSTLCEECGGEFQSIGCVRSVVVDETFSAPSRTAKTKFWGISRKLSKCFYGVF
jgi:RecJ-like exonuclease